MTGRPLDLDAVQAFLLVAELQNFTRAAEASGTTQSAVSLKIKRLEDRLGRRLIERTPRSVRLTGKGDDFLVHARDLMAAHDRAIGGGRDDALRLRIGFSDHASGPQLTDLLARLHAFDSDLLLDVTIGFSRTLLDAFDRGKLDAVIVRKEGSRRGGETLANDQMGWFASPKFTHRSGDRLRIATLAVPCGVRALAVRALDRARIDWVEAFVGGGISAVTAAVISGLAVAPLAHRIAPVGAIEMGEMLSLPRLPRAQVLLYSRVSDVRARAALRTLAAAFRGNTRR
jgi:DNA-binding transcriptional LysR family regulator